MILSFSGTGNSNYVAKLIQSVNGDEIVSINELIKKDSKDVINSNKPLVFTCPTYAWRIPKIVEEFIRKTRFTGSNEAYFVLTCGDDTGNAVEYAKKLCKEKGFILKGFTYVRMPENYIAMFSVPGKEEADKIIEKANEKILLLAEEIKDNKYINIEKVKFADRLKSGVVNKIFYLTSVSAKGFYSTEACISCGKCVKDCPLNNITLVEGKPKWGSNCTHCMACICKCPKEAIEYKNKTKGKNRYYI